MVKTSKMFGSISTPNVVTALLKDSVTPAPCSKRMRGVAFSVCGGAAQVSQLSGTDRASSASSNETVSWSSASEETVEKSGAVMASSVVDCRYEASGWEIGVNDNSVRDSRYSTSNKR